MLCLRLLVVVLLLSFMFPITDCFSGEKHEELKNAAIKELNARMQAADILGKTMTGRDKREFQRVEKKNSEWEVDFYPGKYVMYLDLAYGGGRRDILTAAVHRRYRKEPPIGVSFTLPKVIDVEQGVLIAFAKKKGNKAVFMESDAFVAEFSSCDENDCRYELGVYDKKGRDTASALKILSDMMKYDYVAVGFRQNRELNVLNIPLSYYQEKYLQLSEVPRMPAKNR